MDELLTMDYSISYITLLLVFVFTFGLFYFIFRKTSNFFKKLFIILFAISYFVYSGVSISILNDQGQYLFFYVVYTIFLVFSLYVFRNVGLSISMNDHAIRNVIDKYRYIFILSFLALYLSLLIIPENKLGNLVFPPKVDISSVMDIMQGQKVDAWLSIMTVLTNILLPFYYMSLMYYKKRPLILLVLLILPHYFNYCYNAYAARTTMVLTFVFYVFLLYYYNAKYRRIIVIGSLCIMFLSVSFLAVYSSMRMGANTSSVSFFDAIDTLFRIECTFPTWFHIIYDSSFTHPTHIWDYTLWFTMQPIPGFLKSWLTDFNMNVSIAQILLGQPKETTSFFVPLTGLVGESVFIFGRYLFIFHAVLLGAVMNIFINFLNSRRSFRVLMIYSLVFIGLSIGRTGTSGGMVYPFMIKTMVYVPLLMFVLNLKIKK